MDNLPQGGINCLDKKETGMRNVFNTVVKIIGVWMTLLGIGYWVRALMSISDAVALQRAGMSSTGFMLETPGRLVIMGVGYFIAVALCFFFAWLLVFQDGLGGGQTESAAG